MEPKPWTRALAARAIVRERAHSTTADEAVARASALVSDKGGRGDDDGTEGSRKYPLAVPRMLCGWIDSGKRKGEVMRGYG